MTATFIGALAGLALGLLMFAQEVGFRLPNRRGGAS